MTPLLPAPVPWRQALALAMAAAVALGLARFAYAMVLPPMRADLALSYFTAGALNTVNAAGYLAGALLAPLALRRVDARRLMLWGSAATAVLLALHGATRSEGALMALRAASGVASAAGFIGGGLLAARLGSAAPHASGLVLGLYYGGVGLGIVASALLLPWAMAGAADGWMRAWWCCGGLAALGTLLNAVGGGGAPSGAPAVPATSTAPASASASMALVFAWRPMAFSLAGYLMFGLGYIGYMTFIITLLRGQGLSETLVVAFYALLGVGVLISPWLWAGLLQRRRDGLPMALLNGLLALATLLPVLTQHPSWIFVSGGLFGAVFLSVVATTTAIVRHNWPPAAWPAGISAYTMVFAAGQIFGPGLVGWVADGPGGLALGFVISAAFLALGSALAWRQKALRHPTVMA